jgi:hypothetical protein
VEAVELIEFVGQVHAGGVPSAAEGDLVQVAGRQEGELQLW